MKHFNPGIWTALITPFQNGLLDLRSFKRIVQSQVKAKIAGVIPCGTTGESPTLSKDEKKALINVALEVCAGTKTQVIAGTGSNDTAETVEFSRWAAKQGVNGVLLVTPYYNKPSQAGCIKHFTAVGDSLAKYPEGSHCGIMLYNVPGRSGIALAPTTVATLAKHPRILAVKEASGNPTVTSEIRQKLSISDRTRFDIFSGDDATFLPLLSLGARGVVSVASNVIPGPMVSLFNAFEDGDLRLALKLHEKYYCLFQDLFIETNPIPVKWAMHRLGFCKNELRLPLTPATKNATATLNRHLKNLGLK